MDAGVKRGACPASKLVGCVNIVANMDTLDSARGAMSEDTARRLLVDQVTMVSSAFSEDTDFTLSTYNSEGDPHGIEASLISALSAERPIKALSVFMGEGWMFKGDGHQPTDIIQAAANVVGAKYLALDFNCPDADQEYPPASTYVHVDGTQFRSAGEVETLLLSNVCGDLSSFCKVKRLRFCSGYYEFFSTESVRCDPGWSFFQ